MIAAGNLGHNGELTNMELTRQQEREVKPQPASVGYKWFRLIDSIFPGVCVKVK